VLAELAADAMVESGQQQGGSRACCRRGGECSFVPPLAHSPLPTPVTCLPSARLRATRDVRGQSLDERLTQSYPDPHPNPNPVRYARVHATKDSRGQSLDERLMQFQREGVLFGLRQAGRVLIGECYWPVVAAALTGGQRTRGWGGGAGSEHGSMQLGMGKAGRVLHR